MAMPQRFDGAGVRDPNSLLLPVSMVKPKKEKKRARDKILRGLVCGKLALELWKKVAFLGCEYRRPRGRMSWWRDRQGVLPLTKLLAARIYLSYVRVYGAEGCLLAIGSHSYIDRRGVSWST